MSLSFDKNDPEMQSLMLQCMHSTKVFASTFFPEDVSSEFSVLHDKMFQVMDHPTALKKAVPAPRGLGKTTLAKIKAVKAIVFRQQSFIIYLSNSATSAIESTEHIKRMLLENELINEFFGQVTFSQKGFKEGFSKDSWVAYGDVYILPRGYGQQVRGKNWMGHRPELIIIDDLETLENVKNPEQRAKMEDWFFSDLMKSESKYGKRAEFCYIDTIKHEAALLQLLVDSPDWLKPDVPGGKLSICDDHFNSYDPNYMTTEEIKQEYEEHRQKGKTDLFYMEYRNMPISLKDAVFKPEYFKYFEESHGGLKIPHVDHEKATITYEMVKTKDLITVVICDPARTIQLHAAESAVLVISVDRKGGRIFVRDIFSEKVRPDDLYNAMFERVLMFNAMILGVEVTGLHEFISQPIQIEMKKRLIYPTYIELHAKGDKDLRISALAPYYKQGYIYHNKSNCAVLESQLEMHPKSKLKDVIDALSYIIKIQDDQAMFFDPDDDETEEQAEFDELEGFEEDEMLDDDWRLEDGEPHYY